MVDSGEFVDRPVCAFLARSAGLPGVTTGKHIPMLLRRIARPMLAGIFIQGGINELRNPEAHVERAKPVLDAAADVAPIEPPLPPDVMVKLDAAVKIGAGTLLALGKAPRLASLALAATLIPTTVGGHRFWEEEDPAARAEQRIHFMKNLGLLGGLAIAAADTAGKPSLAWRGRRAARLAAAATAAQADRTSGLVGGKSSELSGVAAGAAAAVTGAAASKVASLRRKADKRATKLTKRAEKVQKETAKKVGKITDDASKRAAKITEVAAQRAAEIADQVAARAVTAANDVTAKASKIADETSKTAARLTDDASGKASKLTDDASKRASRASKRASRLAERNSRNGSAVADKLADNVSSFGKAASQLGHVAGDRVAAAAGTVSSRVRDAAR